MQIPVRIFNPICNPFSGVLIGQSEEWENVTLAVVGLIVRQIEIELVVDGSDVFQIGRAHV